MSPTTQSATNSDITNAYNNGQQLQNQYNSQAAGAQNQYNTAYGGAQGAQSNLQNYTNQIAGQNYGNIYGQDLSSAQSMYGFNPADLMKANQNLATTQTTLANLPQAIQQQGNYYGTTAGAEAGNYANLAGNINTTLAGQGNAVNAYQNVLNATQQQANQQTTQQLAGQQQALSGYQSSASNATNIMQNAGTVMTQIENLQQQQGYLTAEQVNQYQSAYNGYLSAQAALSSAGAANVSAAGSAAANNAQAAYTQAQIAEANKGTGSSNALSVSTGAPLGQLSSSKPSNSTSILNSIQGGGL